MKAGRARQQAASHGDLHVRASRPPQRLRGIIDRGQGGLPSLCKSDAIGPVELTRSLSFAVAIEQATSLTVNLTWVMLNLVKPCCRRPTSSLTCSGATHTGWRMACVLRVGQSNCVAIRPRLFRSSVHTMGISA